MKKIIDFLKTTIIGGIFVLLPIVIVLFLLGQSIAAVLPVVRLFAEKLPVEKMGGIDVAEILAILLILAFCFLTGLLARTRAGKVSREWIEQKFLERIPGYGMIRGLTRQFSGTDERQFAPALVDLHGTGALVVGMIVDDAGNGNITVFVPLSPTPTMGQVFNLPANRVSKSKAALGDALNCLMQWGVDANNIFRTVD